MVGEWMGVGPKLSLGIVAMAMLVGVALGGCSETLPLANLPSLTRMPEKVLTKDEQDKAVNQMIEKGQIIETQAAQQIEKAK
jgi:hypothetical protein